VNLYQGVFSLESITSCILFVSKETADNEGIIYISRHIQASKLLNSSSNDSFPGLGIVLRDVGITNYVNSIEEQENERIKQDTLKRNEINKLLNQNTGIIFSNNNLKYIAEPPLDMKNLYLNSIKDLCRFIVTNSKNQSFKNPNEIIKKFNQQQIIVNKYPELLDTSITMEVIINNIFSIELQEIENEIKEINKQLIFDKINSFTFEDISNLPKDSYINNILLDIEDKFENEADSRYRGMKKVVESQYNSTLIKLKYYFKSLIDNKIEEKMKWFIDQMISNIETAKKESEENIKDSISHNIKNLSSEDLRTLVINDYINNNYELEIKKFKYKTNSLIKNVENIPQLKELYSINLKFLGNFIKLKIREQLNERFESQPIWPKNIYELLQEQRINTLETGKQYTLYLNKKPYYVIARNDGRVKIPDVKINQNYRYEQLECWKGQVLYNSWDKEIDHWFEPENQLLMFYDNNVNQSNWGEGGHISFFGMLGYPNANKPPRPQQKKTKLSIHIGGPWSIESYGQSGNNGVKLTNNNKDMFIETNIGNSNGSINNIKLHLN